MKQRQHHSGGDEQMKQLIDYVLKLPNETSADYYKAYIFYSQVKTSYLILKFLLRSTFCRLCKRWLLKQKQNIIVNGERK